MKMIGQMCEIALKKYTTPLEVDLELLKTDSLNRNQRNALNLRIDEKIVIRKL